MMILASLCPLTAQGNKMKLIEILKTTYSIFSGGVYEADTDISASKGDKMYYEEQIISGVLMFRTKPTGDWQQCSIEKMSQRIVEMEAEIKALKGE